jgi:uncharacterized protein YndB with AHSA1/START domain
MANTMTDIGLKTSIVIDAPLDEVWKAVTTPDLIRQWFFGVDTETDWKVGSPLVHRGVYQGKPYEDKGTILRFEPPTVLAHTHWSDQSGRPDRPEHYQEVVWTLAPKDGGTELTITEKNLPSEKAKATSEQGWKGALEGLKKLLEGGRGKGSPQRPNA